MPSADLGVVAPHSERTLAAGTRMNVKTGDQGTDYCGHPGDEKQILESQNQTHTTVVEREEYIDPLFLKNCTVLVERQTQPDFLRLY